MPGLVELAAVMMIGAERRIESTASNVSNINTPGYRTRRVFSELLNAPSMLPISTDVLARSVRSATFLETGGALDLATNTGAVLGLRSGDSITYSRSAQLQRASDGRLLDFLGRALIAADGGDLIVSSAQPEILPDGVVLVDGQPQGRIAIFDAEAAELQGGAAAELTAAGSVAQGRLVASDVELSDEMLELNRASRMAETGARLFQLRDDLLAKAASQMGSIGK